MGNGLLKPEVDKLQAIKQLPIPKTKHDVRALLVIIASLLLIMQLWLHP